VPTEVTARMPRGHGVPTLIWLSGVKQRKRPLSTLAKWLGLLLYTRAYAGAEPDVATSDHSDIRGLVTGKTYLRRGAASVYERESSCLIHIGWPRILLTWFCPRICPGYCVSAS